MQIILFLSPNFSIVILLDQAFDILLAFYI